MFFFFLFFKVDFLPFVYLFIHRNIPRVLYPTFVNLDDGNTRQLYHKQVLSSL